MLGIALQRERKGQYCLKLSNEMYSEYQAFDQSVKAIVTSKVTPLTHIIQYIVINYSFPFVTCRQLD